jgi:hypothetical protein
MGPIKIAFCALPICLLFASLGLIFTRNWNNECKLKYGPEYMVTFQELNIGCTVRSPVYRLR